MLTRATTGISLDLLGGLQKKQRWWTQPVLLGLYSYALAIVIAVYSNARLDAFNDTAANEGARSSHPIKSIAADFKPIAIPILVALAGVPTIYQLIAAARHRAQARLELLKRHLRMVRARAFPKIDGTTQKARVSLFETSEDGKQLVCVYRTDDTTPKRSWSTEKDQGFVVRAFRYQVTLVAKELDATNPEDKKRYLTDTWADEAIFADRSWTGPAMLAIPVIVRPGEHPAAVFLIEALGIDFASVRIQDHEWDAAMCRMLLEDLT